MANVIAIQHEGVTPLPNERGFNLAGDRGFSRAGKTGEPNDNAFLAEIRFAFFGGERGGVPSDVGAAGFLVVHAPVLSFLRGLAPILAEQDWRAGLEDQDELALFLLALTVDLVEVDAAR